jgi:hypothetical protein
MGASYYLLETRTWGWQRWQGAGGVRAAAWAPSGRALLLALRGCRELYTLCAVGAPPALDWTLMPVCLPDPPLPEELAGAEEGPAGAAAAAAEGAGDVA